MKARVTKKSFLKVAIVLGLVLIAALGMWIFAAEGDTAEAPAHSKVLTDNGDGTYTLSLSVTGKTGSDTETTKANVVIVMDVSGSMNFPTSVTQNKRGAWGSTDGGNDIFALYRYNWVGNLVQVTDSESYNGNVYYVVNGEARRYNGTRYSATTTETRLDVAKASTVSLINSLNANNTDEINDMVEISFMTFSNYTNTGRNTTYGTWYNGSNMNNLISAVNNLTATGGTNWDDGLHDGTSVAEAKTAADNDSTYYIFVSDGNPTYYMNSSHTGEHLGNGSSTTNNELNAAYAEADTINSNGYHFYGVGAFGDVSNMETLSNRAGGTYYSASNADALNQAFAEIVNSISSSSMYTNVKITDGVTSLTSTGMDLVGVDTDSFTYTVSDGSEYTGPKASYNGSTVTWDMGDYVLQNGVTYTVSFKVWPSQEAYDLVAKLNNGIISYSDLSDSEKAQITQNTDGTYTLKTNTTNSLEYTQVLTKETKNKPEGYEKDGDVADDGYTYTYDSETGTYKGRKEIDGDPTTFDNPDGMKLTSKTMEVNKEWVGYTPSDDETVRLELLQDGESIGSGFYITLSNDDNWHESISIAPGLQVNGVVLDKGHNYTFREENTSYHLEFTSETIHPMLIDSATVITDLNGGDAKLTATNTKKSTLDITKEVVDNSTNKEADADQLFTYKITVKDPNAQNNQLWFSIGDGTSHKDVTSENRVSGATAEVDTNGNTTGYYYATNGSEITVQIKGGENIYFINLTSDSTYEIEEVDIPKGYENTNISNNGGDVTTTGSKTSGTIAKANTNYEVDYTNTYDAITISDDTAMKVTKKVTGRDATEQFSFNLTAGDEATKKAIDDGDIAIANGADSVTTTTEGNIKDGDSETVSFGAYTFYKEGTYTFIADETTTTEAGGWTYDDSTKTITVTVTKNADNKLEASLDGNNPTFTNKYEVEPTTFTLGASKTLVVESGDKAPDVSGKYTMTLAAVNGAPMPESGTSVTNPNGNGGAVNFGAITFTEAGEYSYTVTESGTVDGVSNGQSSYNVTIKVVDNGDGTLTASIKSGDQITKFINTYKVEETTIELSAAKILKAADGLNKPDVSGKYNLKIVGATEDTPMPATTSVKNADGNGRATSFGVITYTKPGTYTYTISEEGSVDGVTNDADASGKTVVVTVTDNGNGKMTAAVTSGAATTTFTNTYSVKSTTAKLGASKTLNAASGLSKPDVSGKYNLTIAAATAGAPLPETTTITNADGEGTASYFDEITYTKPGTYRYTVSESGTVAGVTNGTTSYTVEVTVTDDGKGNLSASITEGKEVTAFTNRYSVTPVKAELKAAKKLDAAEGLNAPTVDRAYTLSIAAKTSGAPMPSTTTVQNVDGKGTATSFGEIEFTEPGTYTYIISESGTVAGVTNDSEASGKEVTVKVTDNGKGELNAEITGGSETTTFTNTYKVEPTDITLGASKTLSAAEGLTPPDVTGKYTFKIEAVTEDAPTPDTDAVTNPDGAGTEVDFSKITFTKPGTYTYKISETGSVDGVTNDAEASGKEVTVTVVDNGNGTMIASVKDGDGSQVTNFTNTYTVKSTNIKLGASKTLNADEGLNAPNVKEAYRLTIAGVNGDEPMPEKTLVLNPDGKGTAESFGDITFTKPGTYSYTVSESGTVNGVQNGESSYGVTVTVKDNSDGTLTASVTSGSNVTNFTNTYTVGKASIELSAGKKLSAAEGLNPPDVSGKYTLSIAAKTSGAPLPATTEITNEDGKGTPTSFGEIEYTKPGEYTYTISESGSVAGVENGTTSYDVTVVVTDNGDGTMSAAMKTGDSATVIFENTYSVKSTNITLGASKTLKSEDGLNAPNVRGEYDFTITADSGTPLPSNVSVKNPDGNGGTVDFGSITYDAPGTYTYTIFESGNVAGVTNDAAATTGKTVEVTVVDNGDGTLSASVKGGAQYTNFTNTYSVSSTSVDLKAAKTLEVESGNNAPDVSGKYDLKIEAVTAGAPMPANESVKNADGIGTATSFGAIEFTKPGTYEYKVTESGTVAGVTNDAEAETGKTVKIVVKDNGDGTLSTEVTGADDNNVVNFTNTYKVESTTITLGASKTLSVAEGLTAPDITEKYTLKIAGEGNAPEPSTKNIKNPDADGGSVSFGEITFTEPGVYTYTVSESGTVKGITNDENAAGKTVKVTVKDNGDGTMTASVTSGSKVTNFTNTYSVDPTTITLGASKTLNVESGDNAPDVSEKYTLSIAANNGAPMPSTSSVLNPDGKGTAANFSEITFTEPGVYSYTVSESGTVAGVSNGVSSYNVTVTVTDNTDGTLTAAVTSGSQVTNFTNTYNVEETTINLSAGKLLNVASGNKAPDVSGKYDLTISAVTENAPMPETTTFKNADGNGTMTSFGDIKYSKPGSYTYLISESGNVAGVTNGTTSYSVTVTVTDNGNGTLTAAVTSGSAATLFTNTYSVEAAKINLGASKTLSAAEGLNAPDVSEKYDLVIAAVDGAPLPETTSIKNADGEGTAKYFGDITYTAPGTYKYTVSESGTVAGVTNGKTSYDVEVTVVDNGNGTMTASVTGGDKVTNFTNTYKVSSTSIELKAAKKLSAADGLNPPDVSGKYTLAIAAKDNAPLPETTSFQNEDGEGTATSFGSITYTEPGTYEYTISETGSVTGVTNDANASGKTVIVTVTDKGDGTLSADVTEGSKTTTFTNTYSVEPAEIELGASKTLNAADGLNKPDVSGKYDLTIEAETENAPMPTTNSVKNVDGNGTAAYFSKIKFTEPGTYTYKISESGTVDGVTNDTNADGKYVTVTVVDNRNGTMTASVKYGDGSLVTNFTNTYSVESTEITLGASKTLEAETGLNAPDVSGKYTLTLAAQGSSPMPADTTSVKNPDGNGTAANFGTITFTEPGTYSYTVSESGSVNGVQNGQDSYGVVVTVTDDGKGKLSAEVTTGSQITEFINTYKVGEASIELSAGKKLEAADGLNPPDVSGEYTLAIAAKTDGAPMPETTSFKNEDGNGTLTSFGEIKYTKPGEYTYTITESGEVAGVTNGTTSYDVTVKVIDNGDGTMTAVAVGDNASVVFTNTYSVSSTELTLGASKTLEADKDLNAPDVSEEYDLTISAAEGTPLPETTTVKNPDGDGTGVDFGAITYTKPGEYTYTIAESGEVKGVTNDSQALGKTVVVTVTDNSNGTLSAEITTGSEVTNFTNTYSVSPATIELEAAKSLKVDSGNNAPDVSGKYDLAIEAETEDAPMPETTSMKNADGIGTAKGFGEIKYTKPGEYKYTVSESGEVAGVTNGTTSYEVTVTVVDDGEGTLTANVTKGDRVTTFVNTYSVKPVEVNTNTRFAEKKVSGTGFNSKEFTFTMTECDANGIALDSATPVEASLTFDEAGTKDIDFGKLTYNNVGTHYYLIQETNTAGEDDGWTYDLESKIVKVEVTDNGDGTLTASVSDKVTIANSYKAAPVIVDPAEEEFGKKTVVGTGFDEKTFDFTMTEVSDADGTAKDGADTEETSLTFSQAGTEVIDFSTLTFDEPGTYYYKLDETNADGNGWTMDKSEPVITIAVTDNGKGQLEASVVGQSTFTNSYKAASTSVTFDATKVLKNLKLRSGMFNFELLNEGGDVIDTEQNAADGNVTFDEITYDEVGTYKYTIREALPDGVDADNKTLDGITYDTHEVEITVTVTDNGQGQLVANVDKGGSTTFTNTYKSEGGSNVVGLKVLEGKELQEGDFTFTITGDGPLPEKTEVTNGAGGIVNFGEIKFSLKDLGVDDDDDSSDSGDAVTDDTDESTDDADSNEVADVENDSTSDESAAESSDEAASDESGDGAISGSDADANDSDDDTERSKTFTYTVHESGTVAGVKNDSDKTFTITITDDGKGNIVATINGGDDMAFTFTNVFTPAKTQLEVTKSFSRWDLLESGEGFTFKLAAVDGAPMPVNDTVTVTQDDKTAVFDTIEYSEPGEYEYTITEVNTHVGGVTYDTTAHKVKVTVTQQDDNSLVTAVTYDGDSSLTIENPYDSVVVDDPIKVTKKYDHWTSDDTFKFKLTALGDAPMPTDEDGNVVSTASATKANKVAVFGDIEYEKAGVYQYTITEVDTGDEDIKYDTKTYGVTVTVTADEDTNELSASVTYDGDKSSLTITNEYDPVNEDNPKTGDDQPILPYAGAMGLAMAGLGVLARRRYRKEDK